MHKIIIILSVVLVGCLFALWDLRSRQEAPLTASSEALKDAPDVILTTLQGDQIKLHDLKGKPALLNIWATWCTPCVVEMPQLLKLAERHRDDMVFIALSTDRDIETIEGFLDKKLPEEVRSIVKANNVIFAHDPRLQISKAEFGTTMYPESFIINSDMKIVKKIAGVADWLGDDVNDILFSRESINE